MNKKSTVGGFGQRNINFEKDIYEVGFQPLSILGVSDSSQARQGFYNNISSANFTEKIWITLAFDAIQTKRYRYEIRNQKYFIVQKDLELYALTGNLKEMKKFFYSSLIKNKKFEFDRSILYICCRSGYYDCVKYLLQIGSDVNELQQNQSTPLHVASFYGHEQIVKLLLSYGSSNKIANIYKHVPSTEARSEAVAQLIKNAEDDKICTLFQKLKDNKYATSLERLYDDDIIRIYRKGQFQETYFDYYNDKKYDRAYHGTNYEFLQSILVNGLKKPGDIVGGHQVKIRDGHIQKGVSFEGKENWSDAIFVSPSPFYAADTAYSERIVSKYENYSCLVETFIKQGSFQKAPSTVFNRSVDANGEPSEVEYAVAKELDNTDIYRIENSYNVIVYSILFIKVKFLEQQKESYAECLKKIQCHEIVN